VVSHFFTLLPCASENGTLPSRSLSSVKRKKIMILSNIILFECIWPTNTFQHFGHLNDFHEISYEQILGTYHLDAIFHLFIYFISLHVSSVTVLIIRRSKYINTSSGMISLCKWLLGIPVRSRHTKQSPTQTNHTRWCINTMRSPDDEHCDARNM
jgi:hypothetical protein